MHLNARKVYTVYEDATSSIPKNLEPWGVMVDLKSTHFLPRLPKVLELQMNVHSDDCHYLAVLARKGKSGLPRIIR